MARIKTLPHPAILSWRSLQTTHYFWPWFKHAEIIAGMWGISRPWSQGWYSSKRAENSAYL